MFLKKTANGVLNIWNALAGDIGNSAVSRGRGQIFKQTEPPCMIHHSKAYDLKRSNMLCILPNSMTPKIGQR